MNLFQWRRGAIGDFYCPGCPTQNRPDGRQGQRRQVSDCHVWTADEYGGKPGRVIGHVSRDIIQYF